MADSLADFVSFSKIPRLRRGMLITEKIDGTNAQISVRPVTLDRVYDDVDCVTMTGDDFVAVRAGSRTRWITPSDDNFGFASWVFRNADELAHVLGPGRHFGEWWGKGIQRTYGLPARRFSLFNVHRWREGLEPDAPVVPAITWAQDNGLALDVVPSLYVGNWSDGAVHDTLEHLKHSGSAAAPGFDNPEGVVVFHQASKHSYKVLLENDELPKGVTTRAEREVLAELASA